MKVSESHFIAFPKNANIRKKWLGGLELSEDDITTDSRVCSMHFRDGNPKTIPSAYLGVKFASAPLSNTIRGKRCASHESAKKQLCLPTSLVENTGLPISSIPVSDPVVVTPAQLLVVTPPHSLLDPESCCSSVQLLPNEFNQASSDSFFSAPSVSVSSHCHPVADLQVTVNVALASHIELLRAENQKLKAELAKTKAAPFRIDCIAQDDSLVSLYTGFPSYDVLLSFYTYLGSAVRNLRYWG